MRYGWLALCGVIGLGAGAVAQGTAPLNGTTITQHAITDFAPVTDAELRAPAPGDWLLMRANYQGWGFSTLDQVTKANVKSLTLVWSRLMEPGINEATPIVRGGKMFLGNPGDVVQALDATNGELLWQYRRNLPSMTALHNNYWGQRKRSVFVYGDKVYTITWDNHLVALDAKSGKEAWEIDRGGELYATNTSGPIVVDGVIVAGSNCQEAPFGCFVTGNDAATGKELWRNTLIPKKGEKGDETWGGMPYDQRWMTGVWGPLTYDPELNLVYYGSSGVGPSSDTQRGVHGLATLAGTNTRYAVDPKTGHIAWSHQVLPQDNWDQECTFEMMSITTKVAPDAKAQGMMATGRRATGRKKTLTGVPCKTSIAWSFDAKSGEFLWAKSTAVQNLVNTIDNRGKVTVNPDQLMTDIHKTYHQCPTHAGGRDWPFSAYSPQTNVMYVQIQNLCADYRVRSENIPSKPKDQYNTTGPYTIADGHDKIGRLDAISVETGRTLWSWETPASNYSPVLATAGGLLFNGGMDRYFRAFDQETGKVLWQTRLGSQVFGTPVTFRIGKRQYIAVAAGGGYNNSPLTLTKDIDQPSGGNMLYVFALPEN